MPIVYEVKHDTIGAFAPLHHKRRFLVAKYVDDKLAYVCGRFASMKAAQKRADYLNGHTAAEPHGRKE